MIIRMLIVYLFSCVPIAITCAFLNAGPLIAFLSGLIGTGIAMGAFSSWIMGD